MRAVQVGFPPLCALLAVINQLAADGYSTAACCSALFALLVWLPLRPIRQAIYAYSKAFSSAITKRDIDSLMRPAQVRPEPQARLKIPVRCQCSVHHSGDCIGCAAGARGGRRHHQAQVHGQLLDNGLHGLR